MKSKTVEGLTRRDSAKVVAAVVAMASVNSGSVKAKDVPQSICVSPIFSAPIPPDVLWFLAAVEDQ